MMIDEKTLLGLPVVTQSGQSVGKVRGFQLDAASHAIVQYAVRRHGLLNDLLPNNLIVHQNQVLSLTNEKMIVEDLVLEQRAGVKKASQMASSPTAG